MQKIRVLFFRQIGCTILVHVFLRWERLPSMRGMAPRGPSLYTTNVLPQAVTPTWLNSWIIAGAGPQRLRDGAAPLMVTVIVGLGKEPTWIIRSIPVHVLVRWLHSSVRDCVLGPVLVKTLHSPERSPLGGFPVS